MWLTAGDATGRLDPHRRRRRPTLAHMLTRSGNVTAPRGRAALALALVLAVVGAAACGASDGQVAVVDTSVTPVIVTSVPDTVVAVAPEAVESVEPVEGITTVDRPAIATTEAERVDVPLRVDWIGGSDVALNEVSLPDAFLQHRSDVDGRPLDLRARTQIGALAPDVEAMIRAAVADRVEALIVSFNPVWLHFLEGSCDALTVPRDRYRCLLTPQSAEITAERQAEIDSLMRAIVLADVPVYLYMQPHSADVMADPAVGQLITDAEQRLAALDPGLPTIIVRARNITRDAGPAREGTEFHDMVHLTPAGATVLSTWLAADVGAFWDRLGFAR